MYGLVLGAEKSWSVKTEINDEFYSRVNFILYENENGIKYLKELSRFHDCISWYSFCSNYFNYRYDSNKPSNYFHFANLGVLKKACKIFSENLQSENWINDEYRQEMLIATKGICLMAELSEKMLGVKGDKTVNTYEWINKFSKMWLEKNKESELYRIVEMFTYLEEN